MAVNYLRNTLLKVSAGNMSCCKRYFSLTNGCLVGRKWRLSQGMGACGNEYGPLTETPDWSYADGRPSPVQLAEESRREKMAEFTRKAVELMEEMKLSRQLWQEKQIKEAEERQREEASRLKPKR